MYVVRYRTNDNRRVFVKSAADKRRAATFNRLRTAQLVADSLLEDRFRDVEIIELDENVIPLG